MTKEVKTNWIVGGVLFLLVILIAVFTRPKKPTVDTSILTGNKGNGIVKGDTVNTVNPVIGKTAYAKYDGVMVYNKDASVYKTAKKNEWIGTITSIDERQGYYTMNDLVHAYTESVYLN